MTDDQLDQLATDTINIGCKWQSLGFGTEGYMIGSVVKSAVPLSMKDATDNGGRLHRLIESIGKIACEDMGIDFPTNPIPNPSAN